MLDVDQRPTVPETGARALEPAVAPDARLDRTIDLGRIGGETLAWAGVLLAAIGLRLAALQSAALSPDGARHAFAAYSLFEGSASAIDSAAGGPFATLLGAFFFFLFGVSDAIVRLGPALAGIGAIVAVIWLRPYLGKTGALLAALLLAISPSVVYFARYEGPDAYAVLFAVLVFIGLLRTLDRGRPGDLILTAGAAALLIVAAPVGPTLFLIFAAIAALAVARGQAAGAGDEDETAFGGGQLLAAARAGGVPAVLVFVVVLLLIFSAFGSQPGNLLHGPADWLRAWGRSLIGPAGSEPGRDPTFALGLLVLYEPLALLGGTIGIVQFFLRRGEQAERGGAFARAALAGWAIAGAVLLAIGGARQPNLVLLPAVPLTLLAGATLAELVATIDWRREGTFWRGGFGLLGCALLALAAWGAAIGILFQSAQAMGVDDATRFLDLLLTVVIFALPLTGAALWFARRVDGTAALGALALAGTVLLAGFGLRSAVELSFYNPNGTGEPLVYNASTPEVLPLMDRILRLARDTTALQRTVADPTGGHGLAVLLDPSVEWPARWYLRDFPDVRVAPAATLAVNTIQGASPPALVFRPADGSPTPSGYTDQQYKLRWSFPAGQALTGGGNAVQRFLEFLLFRDNVAPAPSSDLVVSYDSDLAQRLFPAPAPQGPFGLNDRPGAGKAPGQFNAPRGVAIGPDGSMYVVDMRNARVEQFSKDGAFVRQFGTLGHGDGQLWYESGRGPTGIAVDKDGNVYVADTWNYRIEKYSADGKFLAQWGVFLNLVTGPANSGDRKTGLYGPRGIAIGPDGDVYVTDTGNGRVVVYDANGVFQREFGTKGSGPDQLDEPVGIAVSADGSRVYVADSNNARVSVFDASGKPVVQWPVQAWQGHQYFEPYLALDQSGSLYATSSVTRQLLKFSKDGKVMTASTGNGPADAFAAPYGLAIASDGALYVSDGSKNFVAKLNPLPDR
jgi:uncharacterized protein (TIGR03663 family)